MGRKETLSGLVGGMIAFAAYVWQAETSTFFDSIIPNAGYYAVRVVFGFAAIYMVAVVIHWFYERRKKEPREDVNQRVETRTSTEVIDRPRQQKSETLQHKAHGKATLEFLLTSTTDWFDVGIENGTLIGITKFESSSGSIGPPTPYENYFRITEDKSQLLKMKIKATFELPKHGAICLLRKADSGDIDIKVELSGFLHPTVGRCTYTRSPKEKNELTFPLTLSLI